MGARILDALLKFIGWRDATHADRRHDLKIIGALVSIAGLAAGFTAGSIYFLIAAVGASILLFGFVPE